MKKIFFQLLLLTTVSTTVPLFSQSFWGNNYSQKCCNNSRFEVGAEWLYWKVEQDQTVFGADVTITPFVVSQQDTIPSITSRILRPDFKYSSGYRIFADYITPCNNWDIGVSYTHIGSKATVAAYNDPLLIDTNFVSIFAQNFPLLTPLGGMSFSSATARWDAPIDYIDIDISRTFRCNSMFAITPHIGIRGLWIDEDFTIAGFSPTSSFETVMREKIEGFGIEGGLNATLTFGSGFSLCADLGGSLLYSRFRNIGDAAVFAAGVPVSVVSYSDTIYNAVTTIDSFIGIAYDIDFCSAALNLKAGWEQHVLFNVSQFTFAGSGNLTMQGLTLGGSISF